MIVSENVLKWALRLYPPLFFQRIWVKKFGKEFRSAEVKIFRSLLNVNYNRSIFGGTIFSASDPFFSLLFDQVLQRKGLKVRVWLKSASINYLKPGRGNLYFTINLTEDDIHEAVQALRLYGKFVKAFPITIVNKKQEVCASVVNEVYVRLLATDGRHKSNSN